MAGGQEGRRAGVYLSRMTAGERDHIALACLAAALADGRLDAEERDRLRHLGEELGGARAGDLLRRVLDRQLDPAELATGIETPWGRRTAYQMAVIVCRSDGAPNAAEEEYLERLRVALGLSEAAATGLRMEAEYYAEPGLPPVATVPEGQEELDRVILQQAMLAGAAELLPQSVASLVVLPLQLKLVHEIGRRHGVTGTKDQLKELVAAFGLGATSQVVEAMARRVLGGVARQVGGGGMLGGMLGGLTSAATGAVVSFSTTYALGHAARTYYQRGRSLSRRDLRDLFQRFQADARALYPRLEAEVRAQAESLSAEDLLARVRADA
jgi:uncharacterized membrane protein YebE (DUF533 family)